MSHSPRQFNSPASRRFTSSEYFFAGGIGLGLVLLTARAEIARDSFDLPFVAFLFYQDFLTLALFLWLFQGLFVVAKSVSARRAINASAWTLIVLWSLYTPIAADIFIFIRSPLSFPLLAASEGVHASIAYALTYMHLICIPLMALEALVVTESFRRLAPNVLRQLYRGFYSIVGIAFAIIYVVVSYVMVVRYVHYQPEAANPEWVFLSSLFERDRPIISEAFPAAYLDDFLPAGRRHQSAVKDTADTAVTAAPSHRPLNLVLIVMESVGTRPLQLYGAPYSDSPELVKLANQGALFKQIYVNQPYSSAAMVSLFCSIYNQHSWWSIPRQMPSIRLQGLPAVLNSAGYRTAFIHDGRLFFDNEGLFLSRHGFKQVITDDRHDADFVAPSDSELVPKAVNWIKADSSRPFFLTVWTRDTHHPYISVSHHNFVANPDLNRYLNAVHETDALIGQLARALKEMKLADSTLLVITGDHGEAFGEHGRVAHGFTVYDEETRVPLLIVNPLLFPHQVVVNSLGSQVDIAPTLLSLLGYPEPPQWQGVNLLAANPRRRAYLFSAEGYFTLGLVESDFKYVYNFNRKRAELYDLTTDPYERDDLSSNPNYGAMIKRDHLRIEAWVSFQNRYIAQFAATSSPAERK
jgi:arylsulfatase A-like enzyme